MLGWEGALYALFLLHIRVDRFDFNDKQLK